MIGIQICAWARLQRPEGVFGCKRYWDTKGNASLSVRYASRRDTQHEPTWWTAKGIGSLASFNRAMLTSAFWCQHRDGIRMHGEGASTLQVLLNEARTEVNVDLYQR